MLKRESLCRPLPRIDSVTFGLVVEELKRGNRTSQVPLVFVEQTLRRHVLSVEQLWTLLELVPRTADRLDLVKLAAPRLVDPENASQLYSLFPTKQDQRLLAQILVR